MSTQELSPAAKVYQVWLGMDLKDLNEANPYPSSYDPASPKIEPIADNLKM